MNIITALRRLALLRIAALLRGIMLLVIIMAGLGMNLVSSATPAKAASCTLSCYPANDKNNLSNPHNNAVMHDPHVFLIFEGTWADSDMQAVHQYFADVNGSAFERVLTQYADSSGHIPNTLKFSGSGSGSVMDTTIIHSDICGKNSIVDGGFEGDIGTEITDSWDGTDESNTIYFVFTPPGYSVYSDDSCKSPACGYHGDYPGLTSLIYAVIPWGGGPCNSSFPSGADPVLIDINTASHEQFEAITDPYLDAWNSSSGEIGDKCANDLVGNPLPHPGISPSGFSYPLVQGEYSNASQMCEYPAMPIPVCDSFSTWTQSLACDTSLPSGNFNTLWLHTGGPFGPLGEPFGSWYSTNGGQTQDFQFGSISWSSPTNTHEVQGAIYNVYANWGGPGGVLGFPTTDELGIAGGRVSYFAGNLCGSPGPNNSGAAIYYSSATGAHQVGGCIYYHYWHDLGGPAGNGYYDPGFPVSDVLAISGGYVSYFYGVGGARCGGVASGPYNSGSAIYHNVTGSYEVQGCVYSKYQQLGATDSALGYPVSDENRIYDSSGSVVGWASYFAGVKCGTGGPYGSGSAIYVAAGNVSASSGREVQGCVYANYQRLGGPTGFLGFPVSDENTFYNSSGSLIGWGSSFQGTSCGTGGGGGGVFVPASNNTTSGGFEVHGCIYQEYMAVQGGPTGVLGFPTTDQQSIAGGYVSYFSGNLCGSRGPNNSGSAIYNNGGSITHQVGGCIYNKYWTLGGPTSFLGFPVSDVTAIPGGYVSYFAGQSCSGGGPDGSGSAIYSSSPGTFEVQGCIYNAYQNNGGPSGLLGFPISDEYTYDNAGDRESDFQGGYITWNRATGQISVIENI